MFKAPYYLDLGDFADDVSDELIGDESFAQEESLAESSKRKWDILDGLLVVRICYVGCATLPWW